MSSISLTPSASGSLDFQAPYGLTSLSVYNVKDYGAKCDNGNVAGAGTDDTAAVQATADAIRTAGGGILWLPAFCRTTADIIVGSGTVVDGPGRGRCGIVRDSTTATIAVIKNYDRTTYTDTDIHIRNVTVYRVGEATTANSTLDNAIQLVGVTRASVRDCRVRGGAKAIHMYGCVRWWVERNACDTFVDNGVGCNPIGSNTIGLGWIARNECASPTASGFSLGSSSILNGGQSFVQVVDNIIEDASSNSIEFGGTTLRGCRISGNLAYYSGKASVSNSILVHCDGLSNLKVENNYVEKGSINVTVDTVASATSTNVHGRGNYVSQGGITYNNVSRGSSVGDVTYQGAIQIQSCNDFDCDNPRAAFATTSGILVRKNGAGPATARVRLSGAVAYGNGTASGVGDTYGILVDGGDSVEIVGCRAYDPAGGSGTQTHGLYINASTNVVDQQNDFNGNKTAARAANTGTCSYKALADMGQPGGQLDYSEFTGVVNITATTEATSQVVATAGAVVFDGNPVWIEFGCPYIQTPNVASSESLKVVLWDNTAGASLGLMQLVQNGSAALVYVPGSARRRLTPAVGSRTYSIRAFVSNAVGGNVGAGAGGVGNYMPGFIRIVRA